ncbi:MAG: 3-deoxy-7-phosphoheptulonate synthase [Flavobacteriales bacterium]|nr:3-deoxy-7-phosphoheptulonate synthase [Flavobacteriales bacterium]
MYIKNIISKRPYVIAGPCSAESKEQVFDTAKSIQDVADVYRAGIWKPRTNPNSFEGVGKKGLNWLKKVKEETTLKVATEVATAKHVELCLEADIDVLWIGARTTVNPFYVQEISNALKGTHKTVYVKNPPHPDLGLWIGAFERLYKSGICRIAAIHRGFYSYKKAVFRNDPNWEIPIRLRKEIKDLPIICDPSHIAGDSLLVQDIAQTAMDINLDGLMIETHNYPKTALSDSNQQISPKQLKNILNKLILTTNKLRDEKHELELLDFRDKIDMLDSLIIEMLTKRTDVVKDIAKLKLQNNLTIFQFERWLEILNTRRQKAIDDGLDKEMIIELFEVIHKYSILLQTSIIRK